MNVVEFYAPENMGREYGYRPIGGELNPYTNGYHRGQDIRLLAPGGGHSVVCDVVSLSQGRVVRIYSTRVLGLIVVIDTGRPTRRYEAHCHLADISVHVGQEVQSGTRLARTATWGEFTGSGWGGCHDHFVAGDHDDVADNTGRREYDPRALIADVLASLAGGGYSPFNPEEDDMNADQDARLTRIEQQVDRLAQVVGGKVGGPTVFDYLRPLKSILERLSQVVGFSVKNGAVSGGNVADRLRRIEANQKRHD